jgi:hypothetical protein
MSLEDFIVVRSNWGSPVEIERRNRIKLSVAAYAYEVHNNSIMSDANFDNLASKINVAISTNNNIMDMYFIKEFNLYTGQWIHKHPDKKGLERIYAKHYRK